MDIFEGGGIILPTKYTLSIWLQSEIFLYTNFLVTLINKILVW